MPRGKKLENLDAEIAKHYYSAKEAQQRLGMNRDKFNYTMRTRNIRPNPFLGTYGYYKKTDIDGLAEEIEAFLLAGERTRFVYRTATHADIDAEITLAALNFGRKRAEATREARRRFLEANSEITHYLFRYDELVASINLVPLIHEALQEFREGKRGWLFSPDQIEQFEPGRRLECIIIDMMVTTGAVPDQRKIYASTLLTHFGHTLLEWAKRGISIATVDACGGTEDGARILRRAGFALLGKRNGREMYHLDINLPSDLPLLQNYKAALAIWNETPHTDRPA